MSIKVPEWTTNTARAKSIATRTAWCMNTHCGKLAQSLRSPVRSGGKLPHPYPLRRQAAAPLSAPAASWYIPGLLTNILLQTLVYLPRRHGLQYVLNKQRNRERQLAARRSWYIPGLLTNILLQTLIYFPRRHGLQYVLNKKRIGCAGSAPNRERQLAARRSWCINSALQKLL